MKTDFILHAQLAADTCEIGDLPLSRVLLNKDSTYPWLILVPRRAGVSEIVDLAEDERLALMNEIARASEVLKAETGCDKLNVAALGNMVPQLHIHVIARFRNDAAWPKPVWGHAPATPYAESRAAQLISRLRNQLFSR